MTLIYNCLFVAMWLGYRAYWSAMSASVKATERLPIETAPKDGRWIEVTKDGKTWTRARWYETRVRAAGSIAWVKARCWSTSEPSKLAHSVEAPIGWREAQ